MAVKTKAWDTSEHLDSEEMIFAYMNEALQDGDPALFAAALGDVARARGMTHIARAAGVSRESLYKALSAEGHPEFATIMKVLKAMKLRITVSADTTDGNDRCLEEDRFSA
ncbi:addiction module antidote protein [Sinorhizobium meliloti]|uniref:addiction module antidote protein n=1 Tax=Rhizobium meliloti TaxID=382 RepID=UPI003F15FF56